MRPEPGIGEIVKFFLVVAAAAAVVGIIYWVYNSYRYSSLPSLPIKNLGIDEDPQLREKKPKVSYVGSTKKPQNEAEVYVSGTNSGELNQFKAGTVAEKLGFERKESKSGSLLIWRSEEESLLIDLENQVVSFSKDVTREPKAAISQFPTAIEATQQAKKILNKLDLPEAFIDFEEPEISYSSGEGIGGWKETAAASGVRVMNISYSFKVGKIPIYGRDSKALTFKIQITKEGKTVGFKLPWQPFTWQLLETYPLRTVADAVKEIKDGGGSIVRLTTVRVGKETQKNKNITNIYLNEVKLGYYPWIAGKSYLVPIYIFSGGANLASGELTNITIYVLAIPDRFIAD